MEIILNTDKCRDGVMLSGNGKWLLDIGAMVDVNRLFHPRLKRYNFLEVE